jgi:GNAT superfamily N-acetyltransferase
VIARVRPELRDDRIDSPVGSELVGELLDELVRRYGGPDPDAPSPHDLAPPGGAFFVAWLEDVAVGCGGVRAYTGDAGAVGEIKRMYTRPAARRSGVARALLVAIEERAVGLGYARLVLETGTRQPEAIRLYESFGYEPVTPYGQYRDHPESRCFGKDLGLASSPRVRRPRVRPRARS